MSAAADLQEMATDPEDSRLARWWAGLGKGQRVAVALVALVLGVNVGLGGVQSIVGRDPGGPVSSAFSTGGDGLKAFSALAADDGAEVVRLRREATPADLADTDVVVIADPNRVDEAEAEAIVRWTRAGGRLVLAGPATEPFVTAVTGVSPGVDETSSADRVDVWIGSDDLGGARELIGDRGLRWYAPGPLLPVAGIDGRPVVLRGTAGRGEVWALVDSSFLQNKVLGRADNAAFALGLTRPDGSPPDRIVTFIESVHGQGAGGGLGALPPSWKWTAGGLLVALAVGLWSAGSRFGPPEPITRSLRPARREHVEAVAADLQRVAPDPAEAVRPLARNVRRALLADLNLPPDSSGPVLAAQARTAGMDPAMVAALDADHLGLDDALAVGALAAARQRAVLGPTDSRRGGTVAPITDSPGARP